eukprot:SM000054S18104  [mRNA]  locus=s54:501717:502776:+ [translate_table: standard]
MASRGAVAAVLCLLALFALASLEAEAAGHHPAGVGHHPVKPGHHPPGSGHRKCPVTATQIQLLINQVLSLCFDPTLNTKCCTYIKAQAKEYQAFLTSASYAPCFQYPNVIAALPKLLPLQGRLNACLK